MESTRPLLAEVSVAQRRLRRVLPLTIALVLLLLGGLGYVLHRDYRAGRVMAERVVHNVALGVEREVGALLAANERAYATMVHDWSHRHGEAEGTALADLDHAVNEYAQRIPSLLALAVLDPEGRVLAGSRGDLALEAVPRAAPGLTVGAPMRDAVSTSWALPLSLAIPDGALAGGHVVGLLDVAALQEIVGSRDLGIAGDALLIHADGYLVVRSRDGTGAAGTPVGEVAEFRTLLSGPRAVTLDVVGPFDQVKRIGSFRRFSDHPLIAGAGVSRGEAMASWYGFAAIASLVALVLLALGAVLMGSLLRANRRQQGLLEALRDSAEKLVEAQTIAGIGRWRLDPASGTVEASDEVYRIFGRDRVSVGPALESHVAPVHPEDSDSVRAALARTIEAGEPLHLEHRIVRPDGGIRYVRSRGERTDDGRDKPLIVGTLQDVTDEALLRERLRRAEAEYRLLFERNPLPMWVVDAQTLCFVRVNEAAIARYGYTREQFLAMSVLDLRPSEDIPDALRALRNGSLEGLSGRVWRHRHRDGSLVYVNIAAFRTQFDGRPSLIAAAFDVTDRLRAEVERAESELRFATVAEATSDAIWDWNLENDALWWSQGLRRICGLAPDQVPTLRDWEARVHPDDIARVMAGLEAAIADPERDEWEDSYRFRRADGSYGDFVDRGKVLRNTGGRAYRMIGGISDVTERRRDEASLRLLRRAIEAADNGVLIADASDPGLPVVYLNPAFERISGLTSAQMLGTSLRGYASGDGGEPLQTLAHALLAGHDVERLLALDRGDGVSRMIEMRVAPVRDGGGRVTHRVAVLLDVTEREQAQARLAYQESHDPLTGLPNRGSIVARLDAAIRRSRERRVPTHAIFVDLDHFALINDSLGHPVGDHVLRGVAQRLMDAMPEADVVGRFGGDDFVVVASARTPEQIQQGIERITASLSRPLEVLGTVHYLTCSIGHSRYPEGGSDAESLLKNAELAMYQAKHRGRNCAVAWSQDLTAQVAARLHVVSRLREALARDEFALHFQPQYDGAGATVFGLEALVRWNHPERGLVMPGEFIGICEDSGLIVPLGRWVLGEAARHYDLLRQRGLGHLAIAVNVSAEQFQHGSLLEDLTTLVREMELPRGAIELELTESVLIEQPEQTIATILRIKALGVSVSIDDFGTGYSSLSYLRRLPVDKLKIDRSFVADLPGDAGTAAICETIIDLAHRFDRTVVAEGVETVDQHTWLRNHGCDSMQGFLFARPAPFDEIAAMLQAPAREVS
ncbi:MAG TPA: EAL domain-containing protein [Xanthomonadaceae bacterium]|nr:EAL domain-containing protein [Xanthomonadaceae bacterium]